MLIGKLLAVSKFEITLGEWITCTEFGGCPERAEGFRETPMINVTWVDAQQYVEWLSNMTGRPYRLLTEAEWEYAARAGSTTAYSWGDEIGKGNANCRDCGSTWDGEMAAKVGSFKPNAFGLYDMAGNAAEWVEDCWHDSYLGGPPNDGSEWTRDCRDGLQRVIRGGSWSTSSLRLRSAAREAGTIVILRYNSVGLRAARMLAQ